MSRQTLARKDLDNVILDNAPPSDVRLERAILGAIIIGRGQGFDQLRLHPRDFYDDANQLVYEHMQLIHRRGATIDIEAMCASLKNETGAKGNAFKDVGGAGYIMDLAKNEPSVTNVPHYATVLRRLSLRRRIRDRGINMILQVDAWNGDGDLATFIDGQRLFFDDLAESTSEDDPDQIKAPLASQIHPLPVEWDWPDWLPRGMLTMLDGDPELGKSTIIADLVARFSRGCSPPPYDSDDGFFQPKNCLVISPEEDMARVIVPRLQNHGADMKRVHVFEGIGVDDRLVTLPNDIGRLERFIEAKGIQLVTIDPLIAHLDGQYDPYKDRDVRACLGPLARMAERRQTTMILVRHLTKNDAVKAKYRGGGSIGMIGTARAGWVVGEKNNSRILAVNKSSLGPRPQAIEYSIETAQSPDGLVTGRVVWGEATDATADEILRSPQVSSKQADADDQDLYDYIQGHGGEMPTDRFRRLKSSIRTNQQARKTLARLVDRGWAEWTYPVTGGRPAETLALLNKSSLPGSQNVSEF